MMKRRTYTLWHKHLRLNNMVNNSSTIFSFHHPNSTIQQLNNKLTMNTFDNKHIQIIDFLTSHHYQPTAKKGANWWYLSPLHDEKTASFKVDINKNVWYDFGWGKGGGVKTLIELLFHPNNFQDYFRNLTIANPVQQIQETKTADGIAFTNIETEELNHYALYKYVVQRGITWNVAKRYCKEVHYRSHGRNYFALGFPNRSGGYEIRNAYFKGCISPKDISVISQGNEVCHVFEGFIDFLSYVVLHGDCDAVVLNSVINVPKCIEILDKYNCIYCHLDNDEAGRNATLQLKANCRSQTIDASDEYAGDKDLNEYLCKRKVETVNTRQHYSSKR